jgi:hypothetical protein
MKKEGDYTKSIANSHPAYEIGEDGFDNNHIIN